jgi:MFS family permease
LGFSSGLVFAPLTNNHEWRAMFLTGTIMPLIMIVLVFTTMPESPRWLVSKNRTDEAREVLQKVYPPGWDINRIVDDIRIALEREKAADTAVGWRAIFRPTPAVSRMLLVGVGIAVAQQAVGIDAIQYYLLDVIEKAGIASETKESLVLIFLGFVKVVFIFVGGALFDRMGRRPLLLASLLGMTGALFMLSLCFFFSWTNGATTILALAIYLSFFSIGMGPGAWLVASEVFTLSIRGKAMSIATLSNRVTATFMSSTFLSVADGIGWSGFFLLLSGVCLVIAGLVNCLLPETMGRSLEDMAVYFAEITGDNSILEAESRLRHQNEQSKNGSIELLEGPAHGHGVMG